MHEQTEIRFNIARDDLAISPDEFVGLYMERVHEGLPVTATLAVTGSSLRVDPAGERFVVRLLDVRPAAHFYICHLPGAVSWPLREIQNAGLCADAFRAKLASLRGAAGGCRLLLLTMCRRGNASRAAAEAIRRGCGGDVLCYSVAGGMQHLKAHLGLAMPAT